MKKVFVIFIMIFSFFAKGNAQYGQLATNFKFNDIDFDIDRYIIDSSTGNSNEQYIVFANYQYNVWYR